MSTSAPTTSIRPSTLIPPSTPSRRAPLASTGAFRDTYDDGTPVLSHEDQVFGPGVDGDDELPDEVAFSLPDEIEPFLQDAPLENDLTADAIALWWAPKPYSLRSGRTRRAVDVPLIQPGTSSIAHQTSRQGARQLPEAAQVYVYNSLHTTKQRCTSAPTCSASSTTQSSSKTPRSTGSRRVSRSPSSRST